MSATFAESGTYYVQLCNFYLLHIILVTYFSMSLNLFFSSMIEDIYCENVIIHKAEV